MIEAHNTIDNVNIILRALPNVAECLVIRNEDGLTPLDLAFEKKLWVYPLVLWPNVRSKLEQDACCSRKTFSERAELSWFSSSLEEILRIQWILFWLLMNSNCLATHKPQCSGGLKGGIYTHVIGYALITLDIILLFMIVPYHRTKRIQKQQL